MWRAVGTAVVLLWPCTGYGVDYETWNTFEKVTGHPQKEEDVRLWCGEHTRNQESFHECVAVEAKDSAAYLEQAKRALRAAIENGEMSPPEGYQRTALNALFKANKAFTSYRDSACRFSGTIPALVRFPNLWKDSCTAALNNRYAADLFREAGRIESEAHQNSAQP
jgi:uncharacterized protein YecT (DUF1311 family)